MYYKYNLLLINTIIPQKKPADTSAGSPEILFALMETEVGSYWESQERQTDGT